MGISKKTGVYSLPSSIGTSSKSRYKCEQKGMKMGGRRKKWWETQESSRMFNKMNKRKKVKKNCAWKVTKNRDEKGDEGKEFSKVYKKKVKKRFLMWDF